MNKTNYLNYILCQIYFAYVICFLNLMMSVQHIFANDFDYIKKAVWFIEKRNNIIVDYTYIDEWNDLIAKYDEEQTLDLYKKLYYHYPSTMTLMRILHPKDFDNIIIREVCNSVKNHLVVGCANITIINKLVSLFTELINWNNQTKELFILTKDKYNKDEITLKWLKVSSSFDLYLIELLEQIVDNLIPEVDPKVEKELVKLSTIKYITLFYSKNAYRRNASNTNYFTEDYDNIMIFKNGYFDIDSEEFTATISNTFDENNQCMNISFDNYDESKFSKDISLKFIISVLHNIFYNKVSKTINIVYGMTSQDFLNIFERLFGSYVKQTTMRDFVTRPDQYNNKFIFVDVPTEMSLNIVHSCLHEGQHMFINCSNNHFPKFKGTIDSYKYNILYIQHDVFRRYTVTELFADILYSDEFIDEPFNIKLLKENIYCESDSAEFFCKSQIIYDENESYEEAYIYKEYIKFCKNHNLSINTATGFFNVLQNHVSCEGDIGSRMFNGFKLK